MNSKKFNKEYFKKYQIRNIFGLEKGERPFLYSFWIRKLKTYCQKNSKILEIGCGAGYFLKWLEKFYDATGIDISYDAIELAKKRVKKAALKVASAEELPFRDSTFDCVIAFDVIEHLKNPKKFFSETYRVLKSKGILILSTPNPESLGAKIKAKINPKMKNLPYERLDFVWHGWRDLTHINIKKIEEWRKIIRESGFEILKDGTDTLWDVPYFNFVPLFIQKLILIPLHWLLTYILGFFSWKYGENYVCILMKK